MRLWTRITGVAVTVVYFIATVIFTPSIQPSTGSAPTEAALSLVFHKGDHYPTVHSAMRNTVNKLQQFTVMAVGGSSAQGYNDPKLDGYLTRALRSISTTLNMPIAFINKAKSGEIPTMLAPQYDPLLHTISPNIVIIAWGLLNSIARKVPETMFQRTIQSEVAMAIKAGADVWIVTPPVTTATYVGHDVKLEVEYIHREITGARAVHSTHVHVFDLTNAMKAYLVDHHESYKPYQSNNWHMNQAGHVLAGMILADAILRRAKTIGLP